MYRDATESETIRANRTWWDNEAREYQAEHHDDLGPASFSWGPEGLLESEARLLGDVAGRTIVEVGAGAAQCSRWLAIQGAKPVAVDISRAQLEEGRKFNAQTAIPVPLVCSHAGALPFAAQSFDAAFSAYGAPQFVADIGGLLSEVRRVLRPAGIFVFSVTHPIRWAFPDEPTSEGLTVTRSYFDTRAYTEHEGSNGQLSYAEHHRTVSGWLNAVLAAGFTITEITEPEWLDPQRRTWGGWSRLRGEKIPGTLIVSARAPQ